MVAALTSMPVLADVVADYLFMGDLSSSVAGASDLSALGGGGFVGTTVDGCSITGWGFPEQTGLDLDVTGLVGSTEYSAVMLFEAQEVYDYAKLLDTQDRVIDEGLYFEDYDLNFYGGDYGVTDLIQPGVYYQVVVTREASGDYVGYVDGVEQFAFDDSTYDYGVISAANRLVFFRDDLSTSDGENTAGTVVRIRLYDNVLTPAEVAALDRLSLAQGCSQPIPTLDDTGVLTLIAILAVAALVMFRRLR